jgi:hypothetical protein
MEVRKAEHFWTAEAGPTFAKAACLRRCLRTSPLESSPRLPALMASRAGEVQEQPVDTCTGSYYTPINSAGRAG